MAAPLICVIEDEVVIASAVSARLRAEGFEVEVARTGPQASACASACGPTWWCST